MTVDQQKKPRKRHLPPFTDDDDPGSCRFGLGPGLRKKGMGIRAWLVLDSKGQAQVLEAGKHCIMRRTGLPGRDLRILDPMLSYPSTVLGRERAIVVNLEHIKAIVTAQEVLLLNYRDTAVAPFAQDLQWRLVRLHQAAKNQVQSLSLSVSSMGMSVFSFKLIDHGMCSEIRVRFVWKYVVLICGWCPPPQVQYCD